MALCLWAGADAHRRVAEIDEEGGAIEQLQSERSIFLDQIRSFTRIGIGFDSREIQPGQPIQMAMGTLDRVPQNGSRFR